MEIASGSIRSRRLDADLYCLRRCSDGTLVGLSKFGLAWIDVAELTIVKEHAILDVETRYRFNDANCDSVGRLDRFSDEAFGIPDGSAIDTEGCLWNARWDGSAVLRITPDGRIDRVVDLPVLKVADCAFGGADLRTPFISTAAFGMSDFERKTEPMAGDIFTISTDVDGVEKGIFAVCS